jgi:hypothetical protein
MVRAHLAKRARDGIPVGVSLPQHVARGSIIMHSEDIADCMLPAVVGNHRACGIERTYGTPVFHDPS